MSYSQGVPETMVNSKKVVNKKKIERVQLVPYLFLLPSFLIICGFLFYPIATVFYYSLQHYDISAPYYNAFAGLDNFVKIFTEDKMFIPSLINSLKWVGYEVGLQLTFGMVVALLLNQTFKFRGLARALAFIPWAVSGVLASVMWSLMYNEHMGVLNDLLMKVGLISEPQALVLSLLLSNA